MGKGRAHGHRQMVASPSTSQALEVDGRLGIWPRAQEDRESIVCQGGGTERPWHMIWKCVPTNQLAVLQPSDMVKEGGALLLEGSPDSSVAREFRKAAAKFATGITVVLVETPDGMHGMTANAFMSVSLDPLTVAVSIANHTRMHRLLENRGTKFSISVLSHGQKLISDAFAGRFEVSQLPEPPFERVEAGVVIREAAAWFCCTRDEVFLSGDHTITVGRVDAFGRSDRDPLIFYQGAYYLGFDFSIPDTHWQKLTDPSRDGQ